MSGDAPQRIARYECIVHPLNVNHVYGTPVSVIAATMQEARDRAIHIGWAGEPSRASVHVESVTDLTGECP